MRHNIRLHGVDKRNIHAGRSVARTTALLDNVRELLELALRAEQRAKLGVCDRT
jgi:hypothetical protein